MKKKVMNIKPQEVTENGERSVRYKGSDGKFHNIAAGSASSNAQQSVEVGEVNGTSITLDEILPDRFYELNTQMGSCLIVTSLDDDQLAINITGNSRDAMDYRIINSIWENEQGKWIVDLDESATDISLMLLSEHDAIKTLVGNHQQLFEQFLNYDVLASVKRIENDVDLGSAQWDEGNGAYIICADNQIGRFATLTLVAEMNDNGWKSTVIKTFRLSNWRANFSGFEFMNKGGNLILSVPESMTSFTVFRLSGILGTVEEYMEQPKVDVLSGGSGSVHVYEPTNGYRAVVTECEDATITVHKTLSDDYAVLGSVNLFEYKGAYHIEYLEFQEPNSDYQNGFSSYLLVNGRPYRLTIQYLGNHDPASGF